MASVLRVRDENGNIIEIPAIKGDKGDPGNDGKDGADGKDGRDGATAAEVIATLKRESWTFTLADGSSVTKKVLLE